MIRPLRAEFPPPAHGLRINATRIDILDARATIAPNSAGEGRSLHRSEGHSMIRHQTTTPRLLALTAVATLGLTACATTDAGSAPTVPAAGAPPALLALAPEADRTALAAAEQHVVIVRHAHKTDGCNALDCTLTDEGEAEVMRLTALLSGVMVDTVYASAACRTATTAGAAGVPVTVYRAVDRMDGGCDALELSPGEFTRALAIGQVNTGADAWTLVADHSNFICAWAQSLAGQTPAPCGLEGVDDTSYGDVFWLSRSGGAPWRMIVLENAFAD